jgi:DNA-binding beta-propeller fold protein YncE
MRGIRSTGLALAAAAAATAWAVMPASTPTFKVSGDIPLAGPVRWDYAYVDAAAHRLYVAHGTQTEVIDTTTDKPVGRIDGTAGVHGIAVAPTLGRIFTSNGADNQIGVYDLATRQRLRTITAGTKPDAIVYEPLTQRVVAFNNHSNDITLADAKSGELIGAAIPTGGEPEFAVVDGQGSVFFNIEDRAEVAVLDARAGRIVKRYSLAPCERPTGLDRDPQGRLYSVCGNGLMVVSNPATGKVVGQAPIGQGADGVVWLDGLAISANGRDGTASAVAETAPGRFETVATWPVARGARTVAADRGLHKLYLPTARFGPAEPAAAAAFAAASAAAFTAPSAAPGSSAVAASRPQPLPDSFEVIVMTPS